jgi:hypothetical protein
MNVREATTVDQIQSCYPIIKTLRVHFEDLSSFVTRVVAQQAAGYHLVYLEDRGQIQAVAGYRIRDNLECPEPRFELCMMRIVCNNVLACILHVAYTAGSCLCPNSHTTYFVL